MQQPAQRIIEKDDFRFQLSVGSDVFGGKRWFDLVGPQRAGDDAWIEWYPA